MRTRKLVIRLSMAEKEAIGRLASAEKLQPATLARQLLLKEVDKRGLWPAPTMPAEQETRGDEG